MLKKSPQQVRAVGEGAWHEALTLASMWDLPVVFVELDETRALVAMRRLQDALVKAHVI